MLGKSYLVVANQAEAKIFIEKDGATNFEPVVTLLNEDGRATDSSLVTDRPGAISAPSNAVQGVDTMSRKDASEVEAKRFAGTVTDWLESKRCEEKIYHIDIIAEAGFLGKLRNHMNKNLEELIGCTVNKDVVREDHETWQNYLKEAGRGSTLQ
ncbi:host attachment protein [Salinimonas iocasae]|uniref:Host attachment protein n=1 Tax=Salinimonas iocasae TaxID=2572577 RepID=A0A5B7YF35_9ALTE|nr:host attachment protein [Salinimonas iocasae]QCZ93980.1 host attachment protein [Salinimonas iocasae]